jgi:MYXO-CTERM domain-containing protein
MIISLMLLSSPAEAFKFVVPARKWDSEDLPIVVQTSTYLEDSLPQVPDAETGRYPQEDVLIKSFCNWNWTEYCEEQLGPEWQRYETALCADVPFEYGGTTNAHLGFTDDDTYGIYWDDPADELAAGILGATLCPYDSPIIDIIAGEQIRAIRNCDIVMNDNISWGMVNALEEECPAGTYAAEAVMTHEVGHSLGMGHSCDDGDLCVDSDLLNATMYWTAGPCDTASASIDADDIEGITALYGPYITWNVTEDSVRFGPAPLEVCFELQVDEEYEAEIQGVAWNFGDGTTSDEVEPCHTFEDQGQFTVTADVTGLSDTCGDWDVSQTQRAHVLVCEEPEPGFELNHENGLIYQLVNTTNVSTYGCIDGLNWEVYEGGSASGDPIIAFGAWSPKLDFTEFGEGEYTVKLTAMGPAGEVSMEETFPIEDTRGEGFGCSTTSGGMGGTGLAFAGLALAFVLGRRRRS